MSSPGAGRANTPPALSYLSSPVQDLASTLYTQSADEADEANVRFLRESLRTLDQTSDVTEGRTSLSSRRHTSRTASHTEPRAADGYPQVYGASDPDSHPSSTDATQQPRQQTPRRANRSALHDASRQQHLRLLLARLNRTHNSSAPTATAYSNRTPSPSRQSLYDWAPSNEEQALEAVNDFDQILAGLRRQYPDTHPDILRVQGQNQLEISRGQSGNRTITPIADLTDEERRERLREHNRRRREPEWETIRNRRVAQRSRREDSPSATAATERMLRYVMERERSGISPEEERARGTGWLARPQGSGQAGADAQPSGTHELAGSAQEQRLRQWRERRSWAESVPSASRPAWTLIPPVPPVPPNHSPPRLLENALKYLDGLRTCHNYEDALCAAIDNGLATKEFFADKLEDFITDVNDVAPLATSSWLQPGTVFQGHQHATNANALYCQPRSSSSSHTVEQINPNYSDRTSTSGSGLPDVAIPTFDHPPGSTRVAPFDASRPWLSHQPVAPLAVSANAGRSETDKWPVRVVIHAVDLDKMLLQGTMEAYDVPQPLSPSLSARRTTEKPRTGRKNAPITTYLEGHIIDLRTHSFLTPSPPADKKGLSPQRTASSTAASQSPAAALSDPVNFPAANALIDATNWRKLPPFNNLLGNTSNGNNTNNSNNTDRHSPSSTSTTTGVTPGEDALARCLLSRSALDKIHEDYIFMRWKERCFVHARGERCTGGSDGAETEGAGGATAAATTVAGDQDRGHGLTISGFYYVSLRRSDGAVEGLYFDPSSTPYQHLRLTGSRMGWRAMELR